VGDRFRAGVMTTFIILYLLQMKHWKKYKESAKLVDSTKIYTTTEAIELIKKTSKTKFDGTVEIAVKTFANPKFNDQMMRGTTIMPHGTWKTVKIAVFVW